MRSYSVEILTGEPYHRARERTAKGSDTPRDYLERRLLQLEAREPALRAFVTFDIACSRLLCGFDFDQFAG